MGETAQRVRCWACGQSVPVGPFCLQCGKPLDPDGAAAAPTQLEAQPLTRSPDEPARAGPKRKSEGWAFALGLLCGPFSGLYLGWRGLGYLLAYDVGSVAALYALGAYSHGHLVQPWGLATIPYLLLRGMAASWVATSYNERLTAAK